MPDLPGACHLDARCEAEPQLALRLRRLLGAAAGLGVTARRQPGRPAPASHGASAMSDGTSVESDRYAARVSGVRGARSSRAVCAVGRRWGRAGRSSID